MIVYTVTKMLEFRVNRDRYHDHLLRCSFFSEILEDGVQYVFPLLDPCHADLIKIPCPLVIFSQSDCLNQIVNTN